MDYSSTGGDDAYYRTDYWNTASATILMGNYTGNYPCDGYFNFSSVTIPQGATITNAYVKFKAAQNQSGANCDLTIVGNDVDNAVSPTSYTEYPLLVLTTATVAWDNVPAWSINTLYDSPDISTIIEEIVNRAGWVSGNNLALMFRDNGSSIGHSRNPYGYEAGAGNAAQLYVTYQAPA